MISLSTTKKQSKEFWSQWGVGTGQDDPRYCGLKGAWTENLKIMGTAHISHFTNQETMTEAPSLISSRRGQVWSPGLPQPCHRDESHVTTRGCTCQSSQSLLEEGLTTHVTHEKTEKPAWPGRGLHRGTKWHKDQALTQKKQTGSSYFLLLFISCSLEHRWYRKGQRGNLENNLVT